MDWASLITADAARFLQYAGAAILFGTALFMLKGLPGPGGAKPLFGFAALALLTGSLLSLLAQSATMNGVALSQLDTAAVKLVLMETQWGHAIAVRIGLSVLALGITILARLSRPAMAVLAALGLVCLLSFAFTGHGAADDGLPGLIHLVGDMVHSVAAGVWLGALAGFIRLLTGPKASSDPERSVLADALAGFGNTGTAMVAILVATGLVNSYFLVGFAGLPKLFVTAYGLLLVVKLVLFGLMLALAASNRFRLTPALMDAANPAAAIAALRRSVILEALAGVFILGLIAVFGMMEPPGMT
jgi:putative copper resistance protein D